MSGPTLRAQLLQASAASIVVKFVSLAANLVTTILLARLLAPAGYGVYSLALATMGLLAVPTQLGLPTLVMREFSLCWDRRQWSMLKGLLTWSHKLIVAISIAIGICACGLAWVLKGRMGAEFFPTVVLALPLLALGSLTSVRQSALMAMRRVLLAQVPELLFLPILYLGGLALFWFSRSRPVLPQSAMAVYMTCYVATFLLGSLLLRRALPTQVRSAIPVTQAKPWTRSILPLSLISGFSIINAQLIFPILGFFSGEESVGLFRVAMSGAALTTVVGATVGGFLAPHVATLYGRGDLRKLQILARYAAWACLMPALLALAAFTFEGKALLRLAFGEQFVGAAGALIILTIGQSVNCGTGIVHLLLNMTGHERDTLRGAMVGTATNVALALALIPHFGLTGAAIASCASVAAENLLLYMTVHSRLHIGSSVFSLG